MARGRSRSVQRVLGVRGRRRVARGEGAFNRSVTANRSAARGQGIMDQTASRRAGDSFTRGRRRYMWAPLTSGANSRVIAVGDS